MWKKKTNEWYLCLVVEDEEDRSKNQTTLMESSEQMTLRSVAIDPGLGSPFTIYSPHFGIGKIGEGDGQKLIKLCLHMDKLISIRDKSKSRRKKSLDRAIARLRKRIRNLRDDFHRKRLRGWLTILTSSSFLFLTFI